jgi:hypothetical protein
MRPAARGYASGSASVSVDIDALLERVKAATAQQNTSKSYAGKFMNNGGKRQANKNHNKRYNNNEAGSQKQTQKQTLTAEGGVPQTEGKLFSKPKTRSSSKTENFDLAEGFTELSSSFTQKPVRKFNNNSNNNNNNNRGPRNINRNPSTFRNNQSQPILSANLRSKSQPQNRNRPQKTNQTSRRTTFSKGPAKAQNGNYAKIQTQYTPEIPSVESLLSETQLTSQTPRSRILRAYETLKAHPDADVSNILTGKSTSITTDDVISKMKTDELRLNAHSVINALNQNGTFTQEAKNRIVGPLVGLQPVKALSA